MVVEVEEITEEEMDVVVEDEDDTEDSVVAVESVVDVIDLLEGRVVVVIPDSIVLDEYK